MADEPAPPSSSTPAAAPAQTESIPPKSSPVTLRTVPGKDVPNNIFQRHSFWVSLITPNRKELLDNVRKYGGTVARVEKEAEYCIYDGHKTLPPPTALSSSFIRESIRNGAMEDFEKHLLRPVDAREVGDIKPSKATREPFTLEDDKFLWKWIYGEESSTASERGNKMFKELEAVNRRHTWQSWRNRYVKTLQGKPPPKGWEDVDVAGTADKTQNGRATAMAAVEAQQNRSFSATVQSADGTADQPQCDNVDKADEELHQTAAHDVPSPDAENHSSAPDDDLTTRRSPAKRARNGTEQGDSTLRSSPAKRARKETEQGDSTPRKAEASSLAELMTHVPAGWQLCKVSDLRTAQSRRQAELASCVTAFGEDFISLFTDPTVPFQYCSAKEMSLGYARALGRLARYADKSIGIPEICRLISFAYYVRARIRQADGAAKTARSLKYIYTQDINKAADFLQAREIPDALTTPEIQAAFGEAYCAHPKWGIPCPRGPFQQAPSEDGRKQSRTTTPTTISVKDASESLAAPALESESDPPAAPPLQSDSNLTRNLNAAEGSGATSGTLDSAEQLSTEKSRSRTEDHIPTTELSEQTSAPTSVNAVPTTESGRTISQQVDTQALPEAETQAKTLRADSMSSTSTAPSVGTTSEQADTQALPEAETQAKTLRADSMSSTSTAPSVGTTSEQVDTQALLEAETQAEMLHEDSMSWTSTAPSVGATNKQIDTQALPEAETRTEDPVPTTELSEQTTAPASTHPVPAAPSGKAISEQVDTQAPPEVEAQADMLRADSMSWTATPPPSPVRHSYPRTSTPLPGPPHFRAWAKARLHEGHSQVNILLAIHAGAFCRKAAEQVLHSLSADKGLPSKRGIWTAEDDANVLSTGFAAVLAITKKQGWLNKGGCDSRIRYLTRPTSEQVALLMEIGFVETGRGWQRVSDEEQE